MTSVNLSIAEPDEPAPPPLSLPATGTFEDAARDLGQVRERIETAFLEVGSRLGQCAGMLGRISNLFEALPRDLDSQEMVEATARLQEVAESARAMGASFASEQSSIARLVGVVGAAQRPIEDLQRTVKMMGIVAVNARVVAAGVVDEMEGFDVFTTDIATLSANAASTIKEFSQVYTRLSAEVHRADAQRAHFEAAHKDTLVSLAQRLQENLAEVTAQRRKSASNGAEAGRLSRQIANRIATAVSALQVGDTTRQRVEHVEAGLHVLQGLTRWEVPASMVDIIAQGHAADPVLIGPLGTLQLAQLEGATEVFNHEVVEAVDALRQLAVDAAHAITQSQAIYGTGDQKDHSALANLSEELRLATAVLRDCEVERSKLDQVARDVEATVHVLLEHVEAVQDIEANMRLVSLNAAVKCAQLGPKGRALDVIAHQLRQLTGETVISAKQAMTNLREAADLAQSFSAAAAGDAAGRIGQLEDEASAAIGLLDTVDGRVSTALATLGRDGPQAAALLKQAAAGFTDHTGIAQALTEVGERIQSLLAAYPAPDDAEPDMTGPVAAGLLALLRKAYTMGSERQVHDAMFGPPPSAAAPEPAASAEGQGDDLFEAFDFFDEAEPAAAEAASEPAVTESQEDDLDAVFF